MNPLPSDVHPDVPVLFIFLRYKFANFEHFRICVAILPTSSTPSEVGDCEVRFLHVLAIPEYDLNLLCDGSTGTGFGRGQVSSLCFWAKAWLTNIPVAPELRREEVEMEHREVVVQSSTLMLRVWADLDRTYIDGGVTVGGSGDTGSHFSLGASLLSGVPRIRCDLVGYLQQEHFLLSNWGAPLTSCSSENPVTPLPCFLQAQCHQ